MQIPHRLSDLPVEIKLRILGFLSFVDVINLSATNREWANLCNDEEAVWKRLYLKDFPHSSAHQWQGVSWRERYKLAYRQRIEQREREQWRVRGLLPPVPLPMLPYYPPPIHPPHPFPLDPFPDPAIPPPHPVNPLHPPDPLNPLNPLPPRGPFGDGGPGFGPGFGPGGGFFGAF